MPHPVSPEGTSIVLPMLMPVVMSLTRSMAEMSLIVASGPGSGTTYADVCLTSTVRATFWANTCTFAERAVLPSLGWVVTVTVYPLAISPATEVVSHDASAGLPSSSTSALSTRVCTGTDDLATNDVMPPAGSTAMPSARSSDGMSIVSKRLSLSSSLHDAKGRTTASDIRRYNFLNIFINCIW